MTTRLITLSRTLAIATLSLTMSASSQPLLTNGSFENWEENGPAGWTPGKGLYQRDATMTYAGRTAVRMRLPEGDSGNAVMLTQDLQLEPGREYEVRLAMAKEGQGAVAVRLQPFMNGKAIPNVPLTLDWSSIWSWSFPWNPVVLRFRAGDANEYRFAVASYGKAGESTWVDEITLVPLEEPPQAQAAALLHTRSLSIPFNAKEKPLETLAKLTVTATAGDYEPAFLGLYALRDLPGVDLRLSGDLTGEGGGKIPAGEVVIRSMEEQALLPLTEPRPVAAQEGVGWWITVRLPEGSAPGLYRGTLEVTSNGAPLMTLPYEVHVEPFRLPALDIPAFVYHAEVYFPAGFLSEELRLAYYRDMKEHGMNTVTIYNTPDVNGREVDFSRDYRYAALTGEKLAETRAKSKLPEAEWASRESFGLDRVMALALQSGLVSREFPVLWLPLKVAGYGFGNMPSEALKKALTHWQQQKSWPTPLLYVLDEPHGQPERIAAAKEALARIKGLDLPVKTVTANVPVAELGKEYDVWIQIENRVSASMAAEAKAHDAALWTYNCNMPTENALFTRAFFGLWAYRAQVRGIGLWAYYDANTWWMDGEGRLHGRNGPGRLSRICPSPNGPIPTISWETTREGINDYRHAMLFDRLLGEAKAALKAGDDRDELALAVKMAESARTKLIDSIPVDAMSIMGELPWTAANNQFVPVLGFGDPLLVPEHKRRSLRAYIRLLSAAIGKD